MYPLTKDVTWDGPLLARLGSWLGINALWLKPYFPPPGEQGSYPTDRKAGIAMAAQLETVAQGVARHNKGLPPPAMFKPNWD